MHEEASGGWRRLSPSSFSPHIVRSSLKVTVGAFDVREDLSSGRAFVVYEITCDELGQSWVLSRRWNDLKRAMEELQRSDGARLNERREHIPRFKPHAFRFDPLESVFLQHRCVAAEALLQALVIELDVSVVRGTGPLALLQLLERGGKPGDVSTMKLAIAAAYGLGTSPPVSPKRWSFKRPSWSRLHAPAAYELEPLSSVSPQRWSFQRPKPGACDVGPLLQHPGSPVPGRSQHTLGDATWCASPAVWISCVVLLAAWCAIVADSEDGAWWIDCWRWASERDSRVIFVSVPRWS